MKRLDQIITGFEAVGRRGARIKVFIDEFEWAELDAETVVRERLGRGETLDAKRRAEVLATDELVRARKAAAGNMVRQPKTRRELETFLRGKRFSEAAILGALTALAATGTLNDERVVERVVRQRRRQASTGPRRVEAELRARGADAELIRRELSQSLTGVDLKAECAALALRIGKRYAPLSDPKQRQKLIQYLLRRGYDGEVVFAVVREIGGSRTDEG